MARWYDFTPEEAAAALDSDLTSGLSGAEAKRRLQKQGVNRIFPIPEGDIFTYLKQISLNPLSILLLLTAVLSAFFDSPATSLVMILLLGIGYVSAIFVYNKAQEIFTGMSKFSLPYAKVLRDGQLYIVRQEQLCTGDIIFLSAGDIVPADARLIESQDLYLLESGITEAVGAVRKNAAYYDYRNLAPHQQVNMVFASTIVARGRGKAIVCRTGNDTLVCIAHNNRPAIRYDKLTLFDRLQKISYIASITSILLVFILTLLNLLTHRWEVLTGFSTLLALSVAALSEFYTAFARMLVASGIFSAMSRKNKITRGALIKNADKLSALANVTTLLIPTECLVSEREMKLSAMMAGGTFYDFEPNPRDPLCTELLRYGVLSTGIYGTERLLSLHQIGETTFTFEEDAILRAGRESGVWSKELDEAYTLLEHRCREDAPEGTPTCDFTLTRHSGQYVLIVRGDVRQILSLCSHYTDASGQPRPISVVRKQQILTDAGQLMRGSRQVTAIATTLTAARHLSSLGDLTNQLTFEGLLAFDQPLLPGCARTVQKLKDAGMRIILLCPEESERGYYLAESLGILDDRTRAVTATEITAMGEDAFLTAFPEYSLYQGLSLSMRRTVLRLWKEKGETVLYMGRELSEITMIRDADVGATQALTLSGRGYRSLTSPDGEKIPVSFSRSSDGSLNGCDALRFVSDVVVSMVDREGLGGLNALTTAICTARSIFRKLRRIFAYLTVSLTARLLITLVGFLFGQIWLSPIQLLFWGMVLDLAAILTLALAPPTEDLPKKTAPRPVSIHSEHYYKRLFLLSVGVGATLAVSQLLTLLLSLIWKAGAPEQSTITFLSAFPAMCVLLWETGRRTGLRRQGLTLSRMFLLVLVLITVFFLFCFGFPTLGAIFGITALSGGLIALLFLPAVLLLILCELLHRLLGDL